MAGYRQVNPVKFLESVDEYLQAPPIRANYLHGTVGGRILKIQRRIQLVHIAEVLAGCVDLVACIRNKDSDHQDRVSLA